MRCEAQHQNLQYASNGAFAIFGLLCPCAAFIASKIEIHNCCSFMCSFVTIACAATLHNTKPVDFCTVSHACSKLIDASSSSCTIWRQL